MSPFESAMTFPCSLESSSASGFMLASTSRLNSNITRARLCGLTVLHTACAFTAACTAVSMSETLAKPTLA